MYDYRDSHKAPNKGLEYHAKFSKNPHRSMIWEMEKSALDDVIGELFGGRTYRHLDFACGTGRIIEHLQGRAAESVGIDVSESMLAVARPRLASAEFLNVDITCGDVLGDRQFDLITAFRFFPNAQDELRRGAIAGLVRHLSPGGYLIFNNHKNYTSLSYRVGRFLTRRPLGEMRESEVKEMLQDAGLKIIRVCHMGVVPSTDRYRIAPIPVLHWMEKKFAKIKILRSFASNVIYICCREDALSPCGNGKGLVPGANNA